MQLLEIASLVDSEYLESAVLQTTLEAHFSNKDLTNPDTIKKILNTKHGYINIVQWLNTLIGIVTFIISIPTIVGPIAVVGLFSSISASLSAYPKKQNDKTIHKLEEKCKILRDKTLDYIEKHPDKKSEKQKTLDGCDSVLKKINEYYTECENEEFMDQVKDAENAIKTLVKFLEKPYELERSEIYDLAYVAKMYKVNEEYIMKRIEKFGTKSKNPCGEMFGDDKDSIKQASNIPEIKNNDPIFYVMVADNWFIAYSSASKSFWSYNFDDPAEKVSIYSYGEDSDIREKALIEADKRLGYYKLSKCPDAVIPKKLV